MKKIGFLISKDFHPKHTLECGQIFRFSVFEDGSYEVRTGDKRARILKASNGFFVQTKHVDFFKNFFDIETDYEKIKHELKKSPELANGIDLGFGIRIVKSSLLEMIVSFIISANNNIKKIQKTIENLCAFAGKKVFDEFGEFFAFPTLEELKKISIEEFQKIGAGYRSPYLVKAIAKIDVNWLENLKKMETKEARRELISLAGIGGKVADCVLLFGLSKKDVFPVDVWVERVFQQFYSKKHPKIKKNEEIREFLVGKFKNLSGYAQQYLFYFLRETQGKHKPYVAVCK